jgi:hypothetical protein
MLKTNTCIILHPGTDAEQIAYINDWVEGTTYDIETDDGEIIQNVDRSEFVLFTEVA